MKLDLTAEKDGYHTDSAINGSSVTGYCRGNLIRCAKRAFRQSLATAGAGNSVREIGRTVDREVRRRGFHVIRELGGHGIGRTIHEKPSVPNFPDPSNRARLTEGLVLTVEPIIAKGTSRVTLDADKWTLRTSDGSLAAHCEHTLVITRSGPVFLTTS